MSHELQETSISLFDCAGNPIGTGVVTPENMLAALDTGSEFTSGILVVEGGEIGPCPRHLVAPPCGALPVSQIVLGSDESGIPVWALTAVPQLGIVNELDGATVAPTNALQVYVYRDIGDGGITITPPDPCNPNQMWIKNRSAGILTVDATPNTIDGSATVMVAASAAIHLVWQVADSEWLRI